jgi:hypothetical protein
MDWRRQDQIDQRARLLAAGDMGHGKRWAVDRGAKIEERQARQE